MTNHDIDLDAFRHASLRLADLGFHIPAWNDSLTVSDLLAHQMVPERLPGYRSSATHRGDEAMRRIFVYHGDALVEYATHAGVSLSLREGETYTAWCARVINECHRHLAGKLEPYIREAIAAAY